MCFIGPQYLLDGSSCMGNSFSWPVDIHDSSMPLDPYHSLMALDAQGTHSLYGS